MPQTYNNKVMIVFLDKLFNFEVLQPSKVDILGIPYDYGSLMHYKMDAFSKNGQPTIVPNDPSWIPHLGTTSVPSELVKNPEIIFNQVQVVCKTFFRMFTD